jgi:hypothetical protein
MRNNFDDENAPVAILKRDRKQLDIAAASANNVL